MINFVTSNEHKFQEVGKLFESAGIDLEWKHLKYEEIQADTTEEVSRDSCVKLRTSIEGDFFVEDTGLFIDELNGFPGVYSSYVQKTVGNRGILRLLSGADASAEFKTVISLSQGTELLQFTGILRGKIAPSELGSEGFGYDPIFIPEGGSKTLAQMGVGEKNSISHRSRAVKSLINYLTQGSERE